METRPFGHTGASFPILSFGGQRIVDAHHCTEEQAVQIVNTAIDRGVSGDTFIGKGTKLDNHIQVGHDTRIGRHCLIGAHCAIAGVTTIEDDVILWARVSVNKDLVIGAKAVVYAMSGIDKSLEGGKAYWGVPVDEARKKWKELAILRKLVGEFNNDDKAGPDGLSL